MRKIRPNLVDKPKFQDRMRQVRINQVTADSDIESVNLTSAIMQCALNCKSQPQQLPNQVAGVTNAKERWKKLITMQDHKSIWKSINWSGKIGPSDGNDGQPSDEVFTEHFAELLNVPDPWLFTLRAPQNGVYIPVLDDPIRFQEVHKAVTSLKMNKAAGHDGLYPGLVKYLPDETLWDLTDMFNKVFYGSYPTSWNITCTTTLFKKGNRSDPCNYRGISIMPAMAKVYDRILTSRLEYWFQPRPVQAGAQSGRSCTEHIMALRILIDVAHKMRSTLYITFIDFQKAYDRVDRQIVIDKLASKGCGDTFLRALSASLRDTVVRVGASDTTTTRGVKQGAPSSCNIFTFLMDSISEHMETLPNDGWLNDIHMLLYMDDAALIATSRAQMVHKLSRLSETARQIGMKIHPTKSQFIAINTQDKLDFQLEDATISHTDSYTYLGCQISAAKLPKQVEMEIAIRQKHCFKFTSFLKQNNEAPYPIKLKVWESALQSAILYGSETWLCNVEPLINSIFFKPLKQMLGVRQQSPNLLCLVESGVPHICDIISQRQIRFFNKNCQSPHFRASPLASVLKIAEQNRSPAWLSMQALGNLHFNKYMERAKEKIQTTNSSRFLCYKRLNPELTSHPVYRSTDVYEYHRQAFTRLNLASHHLKVETGRWSRVPRDERLCPCGEVQDEEHVLMACPQTRHIRQTLPQFSNIYELHNLIDVKQMTKYCYDVLQTRFE